MLFPFLCYTQIFQFIVHVITDCGKLVLENGFVDVRGQNITSLVVTATYYCDHGYTLKGNTITRHCYEDEGNWTGIEATRGK